MKTKIFLVATFVLPFFLAASIIISQNLHGEACNKTTPNGTFQDCESTDGYGCDRWNNNNCSTGRVGIYPVTETIIHVEAEEPGSVVVPIEVREHDVLSNGCESTGLSMDHCVTVPYLCGENYSCVLGEDGKCLQGEKKLDEDRNSTGPTIQEATTPNCDVEG
jgi:hypothetical protein